MDDILVLGILLTVLNIVYSLVGFFGFSKEAQAAKSVAHGTKTLTRLGDSVEELTQQATELAARAERINGKKRSLLENKLQLEAEAAVEAVEKREKLLRIKEKQAMECHYGAQLSRLLDDHGSAARRSQETIEALKASHEVELSTELGALEDQLRSHFAAVLVKFSAGGGGQLELDKNANGDAVTIETFKFHPTSSALSSSRLQEVEEEDEAGGGAEDQELVCTAESLVSAGNQLLAQAVAKLGVTRYHKVLSFSTHDSNEGQAGSESLNQESKSVAASERGEEQGVGGDDGDGDYDAAKEGFTEAQLAFKGALALNDACVEASVGLATIQFKYEGNALGALADLRSLLSSSATGLSSAHGSTHYALYEVLASLARFGDARCHLVKAVECNPANGTFQARLDDLTKQQSTGEIPLQNVELSAEEAKEALSSSSSFISTKDVHLQTTCVHLLAAGSRLLLLGCQGGGGGGGDAGQTSSSSALCFLRDAERAFEAVLALQPANALALCGVSEASLALGAHSPQFKACDLALAALAAEAISVDSTDSTAATATMGKALSCASTAYLELGDRAAAASYLKRACELFPDNAHFARSLTSLYESSSPPPPPPSSSSCASQQSSSMSFSSTAALASSSVSSFVLNDNSVGEEGGDDNDDDVSAMTIEATEGAPQFDESSAAAMMAAAGEAKEKLVHALDHGNSM